MQAGKKENETVHIANVPPELKLEAQMIALREGRALSDVLRELMENWVREHSHKKGKKEAEK